jgi:hypothetical protein
LHSIVQAARAFEEIDDYRALLAHAEPPTPATGRTLIPGCPGGSPTRPAARSACCGARPARARFQPSRSSAWAQAVHKVYEGLVGKDPESPYVGGRTLKWMKVKQVKYREGERLELKE